MTGDRNDASTGELGRGNTMLNRPALVQATSSGKLIAVLRVIGLNSSGRMSWSIQYV